MSSRPAQPAVAKETITVNHFSLRISHSLLGLAVDIIAGLHRRLVEYGVNFAVVPDAGPGAQDAPEQKAYYVEDPDRHWQELAELT